MAAGERKPREITSQAIMESINNGKMMRADLEPKLQSRDPAGFQSTVPKIVATTLGLDGGECPTVWFDATGVVVFDFRDELTEVATDGGE